MHVCLQKVLMIFHYNFAVVSVMSAVSVCHMLAKCNFCVCQIIYIDASENVLSVAALVPFDLLKLKM